MHRNTVNCYKMLLLLTSYSNQAVMTVLYLQIFGSMPCMHKQNWPVLLLTCNRNQAMMTVLYTETPGSMPHMHCSIIDYCKCWCCSNCSIVQSSQSPLTHIACSKERNCHTTSRQRTVKIHALLLLHAQVSTPVAAAKLVCASLCLYTLAIRVTVGCKDQQKGCLC